MNGPPETADQFRQNLTTSQGSVDSGGSWSPSNNGSPGKSERKQNMLKPLFGKRNTKLRGGSMIKTETDGSSKWVNIELNGQLDKLKSVLKNVREQESVE